MANQKDETTLKCSEINVKSPKTWAWVAAIVTSLLLFFTSFGCLQYTDCGWTVVYAIVLGLILLGLAFLCILRCCACSAAFAKKITPFTQNYWFKGTLYVVYVQQATQDSVVQTSIFISLHTLLWYLLTRVGTLGYIIWAAEHCVAAGIAVIYAIALVAGILFFILGIMNRNSSNADGDLETGPNYSGVRG